MSAGDSSTSPGGIVAGVSIAVGAFLLVLAFMCSLCQGYRTSRGNGPAATATAAAAAVRAAHPLEPPAAWYWDDDDDDGRQEARARRSAAREEEHRRPQGPQQQPRASQSTADLPSFTYTPSSAKRNVTGGGGEEGMCSVCLGAFQAGETVRLLPVCLHLYHVECIDPWLNAHSTCPICRSGTDPTVDGGLLPPV